MTRFSDVVRFINTNHPDHREGLLKANLDELEEGESVFHNSLHVFAVLLLRACAVLCDPGL